MYTKTLAIASLVAVASAQLPPIVRRDFLVQARETATLDDACQTAIASVLPIYSEIPTPPLDLLSATLPADPCETPSFSGSLASEYSSYTSEILEWYSSNSAELLSALASCAELSSYATEVPVCSKDTPYHTSVIEATTTEGSYSTGAASGAGKTGAEYSTTAAASSPSRVSTAGAARETGLIAAAIAGAGFLAAVAAL